MKLYTGSAAGPLTLRGTHQTRLAQFALRWQGWHSYSPNDRATARALARLEALRVLEVSRDTQQFRWNDTRVCP